MKIHEYEPIELGDLTLSNVVGPCQVITASFDSLLEGPRKAIKANSKKIVTATVKASKLGKKFDSGSLTTILDIVRESLTAIALGTNAPIPTERIDTLTEIFKLDDVKGSSWDEVLECLICQALPLLKPEHFFSFNQVMEHILAFHKRLEVSVELKDKVEAVAETTTLSFARFCESEGHRLTEADRQDFQAVLKDYLLGFSEVLSDGTSHEASVRHCLLWSLVVLPRYECDVLQWTFLIACLEQAFYQELGPELAEELVPYLTTLASSSSHLNLVGLFVRNLDDIGSSLIKQKEFPFLPFDWERLLFLTLAQFLATGSGPKHPLLHSAIFEAQAPLGGVETATFKVFSNLLVNHCRSLAERDWLDPLEDSLAEIAHCLEQARLWEDYRSTRESVLLRATSNLREALDVFQGAENLERSLESILHRAFVGSRICSNVKDGKNFFRTWFASLYAVNSSESWTQARPIIKAVLTSARQESEFEFFSPTSTEAEVLSSLEEVSECGFLSTKELRDMPLFEELDPLSSIEMTWLSRQVVAHSLLYPSKRAAMESSRWFRLRICGKLTDLEQRELHHQLEDVSSSLEEGIVRGALLATAQCLPRVLLSAGLWKHSDAIAKDSAKMIYREVPSYSSLTEGPIGEEKCARDSAFALRKLALAFGPESDNPNEAFASSWRTLVDRYVHNRPSGLFKITADSLTRSMGDHLDPSFCETASEVLTAVYSLADSKSSNEKPIHEIRTWNISGLSKSKRTLLKHLGSCSASALAYAKEFANKNTSFSLTADRLELLHSILEDGFASFEGIGLVSTHSRRRWQRFCAEEESKSWEAERYLIGLLYKLSGELSNGVVAGLRHLDYLQSFIEFNRQLRLSLELQEHRSLLIQEITSGGQDRTQSEQLLAALSVILPNCSPQFSKYETLRFVLKQTAKDGWEAAEWPKFCKALAEHAKKLLTSSSAAELGSLLDQWRVPSESLEAWAQLMSKIEKSEAPLFSPAPDEERDWRDLISWCLLDQVFDQSTSDHLDILLLSSMDISRDQDFGDKLQQAHDFLSCTDERLLTNMTESRNRLDSKAQRLANLRLSLAKPVLPTKLTLKGALESLASADLGEWILRISHQAEFSSSGSSRWGVCPSLRSLPECWLEDIPQFDDESSTTLLALLSELGSQLPKEQRPSQTTLVNYLQKLSNLSKLRSLWSEEWNFAPALVDQALRNETCRRDSAWVARRILVSDWSELPGAFEWFRREVVPYANQESAQAYLDTAASVASNICLHALASDTLKRNAIRFRDQIFEALAVTEPGQDPNAALLGSNQPAQTVSRHLLLSGPALVEQASYSSEAAASYAKKFSPDFSAEWADAAVSILKRSHVEFERTLSIGPESLASWHGLICLDKTAGLGFERFLIALIYQTDTDSTTPLEALARVDYLHEHIRAVRRLSLAHALSSNLEGLSQSWLEKGDNKGSRSGLLRDWSSALLTCPSPNILFKLLCNWVADPSFARFGEPGSWRELWKTFLQSSKPQLSSHQFLAASEQVRNFAAFAEHCEFLGCLSELREHPEANLLRGMTALMILEQSEHEVARLARASFVQDYLNHSREEFESRLLVALDLLTDTLIKHDLSHLEQEIQTIGKTHDQLLSWEEFESQIPERALKLADRMPGLGAEHQTAHESLVRGLSYQFLPARSMTGWGFPSELRAARTDFLPILENCGSGEFDKWCNGWATAAGRCGLDKEILLSTFSRLRELLDWRKDMEPAWKTEISSESKTCSRDLTWLVRRVVAEGWFGGDDSRNVARWYIREVIPYAGDIEPKSYAKQIKSLNSKLNSEIAFSDRVREISSRFKRRIEAASKGQAGTQAFKEALLLGLEFRDSEMEQSQGFFSRLADSLEQLVSGR